MNTVIIIPALNPDGNLIGYVQELKKAGESRILVIDDGSSEDRKHIFAHLENEENCIVLRHAVNMGKGRALKNAFNYCMNHFADEDGGVITVDSDGQHSVADVLRLKEELSENPSALILGARNFNQKNVPPKSAFGNKTTGGILKLLYGGNITDTQTGLRAISYQILPEFLTLYGERFEYETGMLIEALQKDIPIREIEIQTIYYDENQGTHFNPIADSWKIYRLILGIFFKYAVSSLSAALIDLGMFQVFSGILKTSSLGVQVWGATVLARIISSLYNYFVNKNIVFGGSDKSGRTFVRYYMLVIAQMCASALLVYLLARAAGLPRFLIKIIVDTLLLIVSFRIQKKWVFGKHSEP